MPNRRVNEFSPVFVDLVPKGLEEGRLYIVLRYRTVTHLCACGCGVEINTPLHPTGWAITYDGIRVSLWPSVGNWGEACRSHYLIEENKVRWLKPWSPEQIRDGRSRRQRDIRTYHRARASQDRSKQQGLASSVSSTSLADRAGLLGWLSRRIRALLRR